MTHNDKKALLLLARLETTRAGNFGVAMSNDEVRKPPQAYARPGGNALQRLVAQGYAATYSDHHKGGNWGWRITTAGRKRAAQLAVNKEQKA